MVPQADRPPLSGVGRAQGPNQERTNGSHPTGAHNDIQEELPSESTGLSHLGILLGADSVEASNNESRENFPLWNSPKLLHYYCLC